MSTMIQLPDSITSDDIETAEDTLCCMVVCTKVNGYRDISLSVNGKVLTVLIFRYEVSYIVDIPYKGTDSKYIMSKNHYTSEQVTEWVIDILLTQSN